MANLSDVRGSNGPRDRSLQNTANVNLVTPQGSSASAGRGGLLDEVTSGTPTEQTMTTNQSSADFDSIEAEAMAVTRR